MIKLSERIFDDYFGDVIPVLVNDEQVGYVDYEDKGEFVEVYFLAIAATYRGNGYARNVVELLQTMYPNKKLCGSVLGRGIKFWEHLGAKVEVDPEDSWFSTFELINKEVR